MVNPAIQNDFSYYRRTLNRMKINKKDANIKVKIVRCSTCSINNTFAVDSRRTRQSYVAVLCVPDTNDACRIGSHCQTHQCIINQPCLFIVLFVYNFIVMLCRMLVLCRVIKSHKVCQSWQTFALKWYASYL